MKRSYLFVALIFILVAMLSGCASIAFKSAKKTNTISVYDTFISKYGDHELAAEADKLRESLLFEKVIMANTVAAFDKYLSDYPNGDHHYEILNKKDLLSWKKAKEKNDLVAFNAYLQDFPEGEYVAQAKVIKEPLLWEKTVNDNMIRSYDTYLTAYPAGEFVYEANSKKEVLIWENAKAHNTVSLFENYLTLYPKGKFVNDAQNKIEVIAWESALNTNTIVSLNAYLDKYPKGLFQNEAQEKIETRYWQKAQTENSVSVYEDYIKRYPSGKFLPDVHQLIAKSRWQAAKSSSHLSDLILYIADYPKSAYAGAAMEKSAKINKDFRLFKSCLGSQAPLTYEESQRFGKIAALRFQKKDFLLYEELLDYLDQDPSLVKRGHLFLKAIFAYSIFDVGKIDFSNMTDLGNMKKRMDALNAFWEPIRKQGEGRIVALEEAMMPELIFLFMEAMSESAKQDFAQAMMYSSDMGAVAAQYVEMLQEVNAGKAGVAIIGTSLLQHTKQLDICSRFYLWGFTKRCIGGEKYYELNKGLETNDTSVKLMKKAAKAEKQPEIKNRADSIVALINSRI